LWAESFAIITLFGFLTFRYIKGVEPRSAEEMAGELDAMNNQSIVRHTTSTASGLTSPYARNITGQRTFSHATDDLESQPSALTNRHSGGARAACLSKSPENTATSNPLNEQLSTSNDNMLNTDL